VVASILRLRYTTTMHALHREWWRFLVLVGGAVWSLSLLPSVVWTSSGLARQPIDVRMDAYTAIVTVLLLGWIVVPILVSGLDDTLEPGRFASLGLSARRIMPGLTASAFLTVPALFFFISLVAFAASWSPEGAVVFGVAVVANLLSLATMVLSARVSVMWTSRLLASRRSREFAFLSVLIGVFILAPLVSIVLANGLETLLAYDIRPVLASLRSTPIGAPVGAAGAAAQGDWAGVLGHLAIALGWVALLWATWRINVAYALVHPLNRGGGARQREDGILASARRAERRTPQPASRAVRAVTARSIRYWFGDPRYLPVLLAGTIGWGRHNDVAYDSSALWLDVVSGRLGYAVMRGRILASLSWSIPVVAVVAVAAVSVTGRPELAPGVVGACAGVLGTSLGVSAVTSVVMPYRAPAPGENPFAAEVGSVGAGLLAQAVSSLAAWVVSIPVVLPLVVSILWDPPWAWVGLITGTATGVAVLLWGLRLSGDRYDRRSGRLLLAVS
jgi:ABC-2 type transport system permease protein